MQCIMKGVARVATHVRAPVGSDLDISLSYALEAAHEGSRVGHAPADVSAHMSATGDPAALHALAAAGTAAGAAGAAAAEDRAAAAAAAAAADSGGIGRGGAAAGGGGLIDACSSLDTVTPTEASGGIVPESGSSDPEHPVMVPLVNAGSCSADDALSRATSQLAPIQEGRPRECAACPLKPMQPCSSVYHPHLAS